MRHLGGVCPNFAKNLQSSQAVCDCAHTLTVSSQIFGTSWEPKKNIWEEYVTVWEESVKSWEQLKDTWEQPKHIWEENVIFGLNSAFFAED
jgi:hypothetical protein